MGKLIAELNKIQADSRKQELSTVESCILDGLRKAARNGKECRIPLGELYPSLSIEMFTSVVKGIDADLKLKVDGSGASLKAILTW